MTVVTRNKEAKEAYAAVQGKEPEGYSWEYALDLIGDAGEQITVGDEIETILTESSFNGWVEVREKERNTVYSLYGSLLFFRCFRRCAIFDGCRYDYLLQAGFRRLR